MIENEEILKKLKVLYVEDDELILEVVARSLKRKIEEVYTGKNGVEGFELTSKIFPDIIITDIEMPQMNGIEMIQEIRKKFNGRCPIIVVTAYEDEAHKTELADAYLYKPVDKNKLFETMIQLVVQYRNKIKVI